MNQDEAVVQWQKCIEILNFKHTIQLKLVLSTRSKTQILFSFG